MIPLLLSSTLLFFQSPADKVVIDNERVKVHEITWDQTNATTPHSLDTLTFCLTCASHQPGEAKFEPKGTSHGVQKPVDGKPATSVVIELKDHVVPALANKTGYPNAFPRPHVKKLFENPRIVVWDYHWTPGEPSPMHFHDKDVVVLYLDNGTLKSTTPEGKVTENPTSFGLIKFNDRNRTHTEEVVKGNAHAVMMELK